MKVAIAVEGSVVIIQYSNTAVIHSNTPTNELTMIIDGPAHSYINTHYIIGTFPDDKEFKYVQRD